MVSRHKASLKDYDQGEFPGQANAKIFPGNTFRVVQIQAISFFKSMSERDGSDMQRLGNLMMSDPSLSDFDFKNKMALV